MASCPLLALALLASPLVLTAADKYTGPIPPKPDVLYLLHADKLIETEIGEAKDETRKNVSFAVFPGASSPVKTPLAEPAFLLKAEKLLPERLEVYKFETTKNGTREVSLGGPKSKTGPKKIFVTVTRLQDTLYKIELDQILENGEYCFSPEGTNQTFAFQVY